MNLDNSNTVILVLLDLSAAFDTIDHDILQKRLEKSCGIKGTALKFIKSFIQTKNHCLIRKFQFGWCLENTKPKY